MGPTAVRAHENAVLRACYNARMPSPSTKASRTLLIAFGFCLLPLMYVLSYAPVVRVCGRKTYALSQSQPQTPSVPARRGSLTRSDGQRNQIDWRQRYDEIDVSVSCRGPTIG